MTDKGKDSLSSTASSRHDKDEPPAVKPSSDLSPGAEADALMDAQALLAAAVGSHEAAKLSQVGGRVDQLWRTAAIVLGAALVLVGCLFFQDQIGNPFQPAPSLDNMMLPPKTRSLSKIALGGGQPLVEIAAKVAPSVVKVEIEAPPKPGQENLKTLGFIGGPRITNGDEAPEKSLVKYFGTGLVIRSDGYILTSRQFIAPGAAIKVTLGDKRRLEAEIVGEDSFSDLALLKVEAQKLPVPNFGSTKDLRAGDWAIAIGSPIGIEQTVNLGIVSAVGRERSDSTFHNKIDLIQTDCVITPGNVGGPLLNIAGEIVGINTAIRSEAQSLSFAVPIEEVRKVTTQLIAHGEISRPYLGIFMHDVDAQLCRRLRMPEDLKGVLIWQIMPDSPCQKAGIGQFDVLVKVQGKVADSAKTVREMIADLKPGNTVEMVVWRNGATQTRKVLVGKYPTEL